MSWNDRMAENSRCVLSPALPGTPNYRVIRELERHGSLRRARPNDFCRAERFREEQSDQAGESEGRQNLREADARCARRGCTPKIHAQSYKRRPRFALNA